MDSIGEFDPNCLAKLKPIFNLSPSSQPKPIPADCSNRSECSEIYLDDKEFMSKAIRIDPNSIKFASKKLRQNKSIAKIILKKDKKLAKKFIFKKVLSEIKYRKN